MGLIYKRRANYYETDQMGIVHHSNYIRYFEEARLAFMRENNCDVRELEQKGVIIPNVDAYARYHIPTRFDEVLDIEVRLTSFNGAKMEYTYTARNQNGDIAATGHTLHCFVNSDFRPVSLRRADPGFYQRLSALLEPEE